ncbi:hypothetical protein GCM10007886_54430 [Methylobacterium gregans]|nr:hypothetical protein GCM10007886_54430 [Methylobacterium gregans]
MSVAELAGAFGAIGVERFHVDLVRGETTVYQGDYTAVLPADAPAKRPAPRFWASGIEGALIGTDAGSYTWPAFCGLVLEARCAGFIVSLFGRRALFYGEAGEVLTKDGPFSSSSPADG